MRVATHPMLAGYVFKVFFIDERECERKKSCGWKDYIAGRTDTPGCSAA
jgi:hypothetical protein